MGEVIGNILDVATEPDSIIFHQANTLGLMGAGLARQIRMRWPRMYLRYREICKSGGDGLLGKYALFRCCDYDHKPYLVAPPGYQQDTRSICFLFGQNTVGKTGLHTKYPALFRALEQASHLGVSPCYFPYMMGCGLGGGVWSRVLPAIKYYFPRAIIVRLKEDEGV